MQFQSGDAERITKCVSKAEEGTTAEIVVVVRPQSGSYRDVSLSLAATAALLVLLGNLFVPWLIPEWVIALESIAVYVVVYLLSQRLRLYRFFVGQERRREQVRVAATLAFVSNRVYTTTAHTGILVYLSLVENELHVIPDDGVVQSMPRDEWAHWLNGCRRVLTSKSANVEALATHFNDLGTILARHLPAGVQKINQLPDAPCMEGTLKGTCK